MFAIDTSSLVSFLAGDLGLDTEIVQKAFEECQIALPPPVLTEILSTPNLQKDVKVLLIQMPLIEISVGFWQRAGELRNLVLKRGLKARLGDCLIAQICLDHNVPLISRDRDFKNIQKISNLKVLGLE